MRYGVAHRPGQAPGDPTESCSVRRKGHAMTTDNTPSMTAAKDARRTAERPYDIILFGGTGFTGGLTAEYLAAHAPEETRWALAGRNQGKLEALMERLVALNPACADLPLLHADVTAPQPRALIDIAEQTRVVITTVGP